MEGRLRKDRGFCGCDGGRLQRGTLSSLSAVGARYERPPAPQLRRQRGNGACRRAAVSGKRIPRRGARLGREKGGRARRDARAKRHTAAARLSERRSAAGGTRRRRGGRALRGTRGAGGAPCRADRYADRRGRAAKPQAPPRHGGPREARLLRRSLGRRSRGARAPRHRPLRRHFQAAGGRRGEGLH